MPLATTQVSDSLVVFAGAQIPAYSFERRLAAREAVLNFEFRMCDSNAMKKAECTSSLFSMIHRRR